MKKRSITLKGHRTSVVLEPEFWAVIEQAAARRGLSLAALVADVDIKRTQEQGASGLASALRVFALREASGARGEAD